MNKFNLKICSNLDCDYDHNNNFFSSSYIWKFYCDNNSINKFYPHKYGKLPVFCLNRKENLHTFGIQLEKYKINE